MGVTDFGTELQQTIDKSLRADVKSLRPFGEAAKLMKEKVIEDPREGLKAFMMEYIPKFIGVVRYGVVAEISKQDADILTAKREEVDLGVEQAEKFVEAVSAIPLEMREEVLGEVYFGVKNNQALIKQLGAGAIEKFVVQWQGWMGELKAQELLEDCGWQVVRHKDMDLAGVDILGIKVTETETVVSVIQVKPDAALKLEELDPSQEETYINQKRLRPRSMRKAVNKLFETSLAEVRADKIVYLYVGVPVESAVSGIGGKTKWWFMLSNGELMGSSEEFIGMTGKESVVKEFDSRINELVS